MLTDVLSPLVRANVPHGIAGLHPGLLADWYSQVLRLKNDIGQWVNKHNKHIMVGAYWEEDWYARMPAST